MQILQAVVSSQILILQLLCTFVSTHCTCHSSVRVISFSYVSVQIFQERDTSALLPNPKGLRIAMVMWIICTTTLHHFSNVESNVLTLPNILVDMVSSDHRVYNNNDSTSDSTSHAIAHDDFTRSSNLVIGYFADIIIITDISYCWAEKLTLCRNWASHTKPAIQYIPHIIQHCYENFSVWLFYHAHISYWYIQNNEFFECSIRVF